MPPKKKKVEETNNEINVNINENEPLETTRLRTNINQPQTLPMTSTMMNPELCKILKSYTSTQQIFIETSKKMEQYTEQTLLDIQNKIDNKVNEYNELDKQLKREYLDKRYDLEKDFLMYKDDMNREILKMKDEMNRKFQKDAYEQSVKYLREMNEVPIKEKEVKEVKMLEIEYEKMLSKEKAILNEQHKKDMENKIITMELEHKHDISKLTAETEQKTQTIHLLEQMILGLKEEIKEQRMLTCKVAEASKQGAITQNYGK